MRLLITCAIASFVNFAFSLSSSTKQKTTRSPTTGPWASAVSSFVDRLHGWPGLEVLLTTTPAWLCIESRAPTRQYACLAWFNRSGTHSRLIGFSRLAWCTRLIDPSCSSHIWLQDVKELHVAGCFQIVMVITLWWLMVWINCDLAIVLWEQNSDRRLGCRRMWHPVSQRVAMSLLRVQWKPRLDFTITQYDNAVHRGRFYDDHIHGFWCYDILPVWPSMTS